MSQFKIYFKFILNEFSLVVISKNTIWNAFLLWSLSLLFWHSTTHTHTHTRTPTYTRTRARTHMQVSFTLPITCVVEVLLFPYIGALTDYSPHRKNIWLTAFGLLMLTSMLIAVMWHNYVWWVRRLCEYMVWLGIVHELPVYVYVYVYVYIYLF